MEITTDDMIDQLRRRKVPYDRELNDSIDYAISCVKARDSLESTARKYRKLQAEYETRLKTDMLNMLEDLKKDIEGLDFFEGEKPVNITRDIIDEVKSWEHGTKDCKKLIQDKINTLKENKNNG